VRLFFALWPDESVRAALADRAAALHALCGGRSTRTENLHLTLLFSERGRPTRRRDRARAGEVAPRKASLLLDRIGFWKRLAWAGASAVPGQIEGLVLELRDALTRSRIDFDRSHSCARDAAADARQPREMPVVAPIAWNLDGFALCDRPAGAAQPTRCSTAGGSERDADAARMPLPPTLIFWFALSEVVELSICTPGTGPTAAEAKVLPSMPWNPGPPDFPRCRRRISRC